MVCGNLTLFNDVQFAKTLLPIVVRPSGNITPDMPLPLKASPAISVTPVGMVSEAVMDGVSRKAEPPMKVSAVGNLLSTKFSQPLKASFSILVIWSFNVIVFSDLHKRKALLRMVRIPLCIVTVFRFSQFSQ